MSLTIPPPRNVLCSYHFFKDFDLDRISHLRVIGDSGAFSAKSVGAEITTANLAAWANKWRHRLCWVAALDVIGDAEATRRNWHEMVDEYGVPGVPTIHFGCPPETMDYYVERGVDFIGLGGLVGRPAPAQMRWMVSMFRYARDKHPDLRFHGWGVTSRDALKLPFFSVDSSGWTTGVRYGRVILRDPHTGQAHEVQTLLGNLAALGCGDLAELQAQLDVLAHGQPRVEVRVLEHHPPLPGRAEDRFAVDHGDPAGGLEETGEDLQQGGLPAAGRSHHADEGSRLHAQRGVRQGVHHLTAVGDVPLGDRLEGEAHCPATASIASG